MILLIAFSILTVLHSACCQNKSVVCYVSNWSGYRAAPYQFTMDNLDPQLCTHIIYAFAIMDSETLTIVSHDPDVDIDQRGFEKATMLKYQGVKVLIAVGGYKDSDAADPKWSTMMSNPVSRGKFVQSVLEFLEEHNFDGLDMDYEYPGCPQGSTEKPDDMVNYNSLMQELRKAFGDRYLLTAATSGGVYNAQRCYSDMGDICLWVDWLNVMTYDMHGDWEHKTGGNAPISEVTATVDKYLNDFQCPAEKIVLGVPLYGRSFTLAQGAEAEFGAPAENGAPGTYTDEGGLLAFFEICDKIKQGELTRGEGSEDQGGFAFGGDQFVSYDTTTDVANKADLVLEKDLGGAMVWVLDQDDFSDACGCGSFPLVKTLSNKLQGSEFEINPGC